MTEAHHCLTKKGLRGLLLEQRLKTLYALFTKPYHEMANVCQRGP